MNKKIKLILSISSCCVMLSLIIFAVWASSQVTYTITNTASYYVNQYAMISVDRKIYPLKLAKNTLDYTGALDQVDIEDSDFSEVAAYTYSNKSYTTNAGVNSFIYNYSFPQDSYTCDYNVSYCYKVVINVKTANNDGCKFNITYTQGENVSNTALNNGSNTLPSNLTNVQLEKNDIGLSYTYYLHIIDITTPIKLSSNIVGANVAISFTPN